MPFCFGASLTKVEAHGNFSARPRRQGNGQAARAPLAEPLTVRHMRMKRHFQCEFDMT
ncbi:protein of unknown function [Methylocella tundrae]|uniref:Uncharacterized protein n=1 Tax=Methylocella tundrae TaxID=227605 RepID=A0A4U8Z5A0_METTU|nr:protein of unknown function [Methylocella tundrae]